MSVLAGAFGGPLAATAVNRGAGYLIDRYTRGGGYQLPGVDYQSGYMPTVDAVMPGQPAFDINRGGQNLGLPGGLPSAPMPDSSPSAGIDYAGIMDRMNGWGNGPGGNGYDSRSGNSTRSGVLAEGQDAQNYVANMQLGNWLGLKAPTGPGAPTQRIR